jgi:oligopeptidase A
VTEFFTARSGADERLYAKVQGESTQCAAAEPGPPAARWPTRVRDFALGGAELQGAARERYAGHSERAGRVVAGASAEHVLDATDAVSRLPSTSSARLRACRPTWRQRRARRGRSRAAWQARG